MILRRLGNKAKLADKIYQYFPPHETRILPFFGAGGDYFNMPYPKYCIANDLDSDVYNLFTALLDRKEELYSAIELMPIHSDLLNYWKKHKETDPLKKALRFLFLSNYTFMGMGDTIRYQDQCNAKKILLDRMQPTFDAIKFVKFMNFDFRKVFKSTTIRNTESTFIYCDPPYLDTEDNYSNGFTKTDSNDLFDILCSSGVKFAYSEFDHPFILQQVKERNLNVIEIGERKNLGNRRTEILVTNYKTNQNQLKLF